MYCKGYTVCPQWVNDYTNLRTSARLGARLNDENSSRGETPAPKVRLEPVTLVPVEPGSIHVPEVAVAAKMNGTRGAQVLRTLQGDMRKLTYGLTPTIIEFRQPSADTVEVVYSYPGYDGLIGLRRNVAERQVDVPATDPAYQVAANENDPREIATMLRLDLEEPPPTDALRPAIDGIAWWGAR